LERPAALNSPRASGRRIVTRIVTSAALREVGAGVHDAAVSLHSIPHPSRMSPDDAELMLWALTHGWTVKLVASDPPECLWRDPGRRRFLVQGAGPSRGLPALSDEVRGRMGQARAAAAAPIPVLAAG
jgi:hypothetical protein